MKKLILKKEELISMSNAEMKLTKGGAEARSDKKKGECRYSRLSPDGYWKDTNDDGCQEFHKNGCKAK